jgi:hypothetical protein
MMQVPGGDPRLVPGVLFYAFACTFFPYLAVRNGEAMLACG